MKSPEQYEKEIREQRLVEATKKGLTGRNGKIALVLKTLGQPIVHQSNGGGFHDVNYLDADMWGEPINEARNAEQLRDRIPMYLDGNPEFVMIPGGKDEDEDPSSPEWRENTSIQQVSQFIVGWVFDGLSRSMHLEIKYTEVDKILVCYYKGYEVYKEIQGELVVYAPINEWENWISKLSKVSKQQQIKLQAGHQIEESQEARRKKNSWWKNLRQRWGL